MRIIVFAAGSGHRLGNIAALPKCLIEINGETLLERYIKIFQYLNLMDIVLVVGYKGDVIVEALKAFSNKKKAQQIRIIKNARYREGSILSLYEARGALDGDVLLMDSDMIFEPALIETIVSSDKDDFFLIDRASSHDDEAVLVGFKDHRAVDLERGLQGEYDILGEWAGCLKLSPHGAKRLKKLVTKKVSDGERQLGYEFIIPELFEHISIGYELVDGMKWIEIDFPDDVENAKKLGVKPIRAH